MDLILVLSNKLSLSINEHLNMDSEEFQKLKYGVSVLLINISKISILFILAYILGIFKYTLLYFLSFCIIRSFAFGIHAEKSLNCTLCNFIIFIGGTHLSIFLKLNNHCIILIFIFNLILLGLYSPSDTKARPITNKKLRMKLRIKTLIAATALMFLALIIPNNIYKTLISLGVFSEALCITPLTYKIFKKEYDNYEKCINK